MGKRTQKPRCATCQGEIGSGRKILIISLMSKLSTLALFSLSRTTRSGGYDELNMPKQSHLDLHREILSIFFENLKEMQNELKSTLQKIAVDNTVVVMTVNKGQSELLINFVCSALSRGLDLKNVILFPTDLFSKGVADGLGLATFYNDKVR